MTDLQLYLIAGIPTLAVLVGIVTNQILTNRINARLRNFENRLMVLFDRFEARFDTLDRRFDILLKKLST